MNINIDPEFKAVIPPLTGKDFDNLEKSILNEGCRDALILWNNILIDGHNRYEICKKHNIPFKTISVNADLKDREDVKLWIMQNQLARRNLSDFQKIEMVHACEDAVRAKAKQRQAEYHGNQYDSGHKEIFPEVQNNVQSRDELGSMAGVSGKTYEHAVKVLDEAPAPVVEAARKEEISINTAYQVTKMEPEQKEEIAHRIEHIDKEPEETNTPKKIVQEVVKRPHVSYNSGNNEWYTPQPIIDAARETMGEIDLDPASSEIANATVKAENYFTYEDDGLNQKWFGNVWLNPPYASDLIGRFVDKTLAERANYEQAIVLVNNATETGWFLKLVSIASAICFPYSRVKYYMPNGKVGAPLQGQAIIYIGNNADIFSEEFESIGWIARDLYGIYE